MGDPVWPPANMPVFYGRVDPAPTERKKPMQNYMRIEIPAKSSNESLARSVVAAFAAQLDITMEDMQDIKTAVSEAVTNAIIHGYGVYSEGDKHDENDTTSPPGEVCMSLRIEGRTLYVQVSDNGAGIADIAQARQPLFTTLPEAERSGLGFTVMENFMDRVDVVSSPGKGTCVDMVKQLPVAGHTPVPTGGQA